MDCQLNVLISTRQRNNLTKQIDPPAANSFYRELIFPDHEPRQSVFHTKVRSWLDIDIKRKHRSPPGSFKPQPIHQAYQEISGSAKRDFKTVHRRNRFRSLTGVNTIVPRDISVVHTGD